MLHQFFDGASPWIVNTRRSEYEHEIFRCTPGVLKCVASLRTQWCFGCCSESVGVSILAMHWFIALFATCLLRPSLLATWFPTCRLKTLILIAIPVFNAQGRAFHMHIWMVFSKRADGMSPLRCMMYCTRLAWYVYSLVFSALNSSGSQLTTLLTWPLPS